MILLAALEGTQDDGLLPNVDQYDAVCITIAATVQADLQLKSFGTTGADGGV